MSTRASLAERRAAIGEALRQVERHCRVAERLGSDPIGVVRARRYADHGDVELAALLAACLAFGNAKALRAKVADVLERLGPRPARFADSPGDVRRALGGFRHRVYGGADVARLTVGARRVQVRAGSLGGAFAEALTDSGSLRGALGAWTSEIRREGGLDRAARARRGAAHLLPDPEKASACKRLMLYLRWMVRPDDGVDLGLWTRSVSTAALVVPLDVHVFRLAKNLGLTRRRSADWTAAEEVTRELRRYDPLDPVRFDFSLCHMGMALRCPSRRDARLCEGCGVKPVCRHWA